MIIKIEKRLENDFRFFEKFHLFFAFSNYFYQVEQKINLLWSIFDYNLMVLSKGHNSHFVNFRLESLHFTDDRSAFWVLDPSSDASVRAIIAAVFCEANAWKFDSQLIMKISPQLSPLPWTWPKTSKSHWTNKFESSIPIPLWKVQFTKRFSLSAQLCHRTDHTSIATEVRVWKFKEPHEDLKSFCSWYFWFLVTSLSPNRKEKKSFRVEFFSRSRTIFSDWIFRSDWRSSIRCLSI